MYKCDVCNKSFQYPHTHYWGYSGIPSNNMCPWCGNYDLKVIS